MNYVIERIRSHRKEYPAATSPKVASRFLTVEQYLSLSRRIIGRFAPPDVRAMMLGSEDAVDYVAHKIMKGDWDYDGRCKIQSYRGYRGRKAISQYLKVMGEKNRAPLVVGSLDYAYPDGDGGNAARLYDWVADPTAPEPVDLLIESEHVDRCRLALGRLMATLSQPQRRCLSMYHIDGLSSDEISEKLGITRQAVQQAIKRGMQVLREAAGVSDVYQGGA